MNETGATQGPTPTPTPTPDHHDAGELIAEICWLSMAWVPIALAIRLAITLLVPGAGGPAWVAVLIGVAAAAVAIWLWNGPTLEDGSRADRIFIIGVVLPMFLSLGAAIALFVAYIVMTTWEAPIWLAAPMGVIVGALATLLVTKSHSTVVEAMPTCGTVLLLICILFPVLQQARAYRNHLHHRMSEPAHRRYSDGGARAAMRLVR